MQIKVAEESRSSFLTFVKKVWPEFIAGSHHKIIAQKFEDISRGKIKRLIVNMPPDIQSQSLLHIYFLHGCWAKT